MLRLPFLANWSFILFLTLPCFSSVPLTMNYSGYLQDNSGKAMALNGQDVIFCLYQGAASSSRIWVETLQVTATNGFISAVLGKKRPLTPAVLDRDSIYFEVSVPSVRTFPRTALSAVSFSVLANTADTARLAKSLQGNLGANRITGLRDTIQAVVQGDSNFTPATHASNYTNPHQVTLTQAAAAGGNIDVSKISNFRDSVTAITSQDTDLVRVTHDGTTGERKCFLPSTWIYNQMPSFTLKDNNQEYLKFYFSSNIINILSTLSLRIYSYGSINFDATDILFNTPNVRLQESKFGINLPIDSMPYACNVKGGIGADSIIIQGARALPDTVFSPGYQLDSLVEVQAFLEKHHHLEGVPSAQDVAKNGLNYSTMLLSMLQKVEELYLYTIQQDGKIKRLETDLNELQKQAGGK